MKILITGAAGFIGSKLAYELACLGHEVVGIDNINTYYDPNLKYARIKEFYGIEPEASWPTSVSKPENGTEDKEVEHPDMPCGHEYISPLLSNLSFMRIDITDLESLMTLFEDKKFDKVMNLAAQAGVRYSIKNPLAYAQSNVVGFTNILECCRSCGVKHLIYASSSSVYGGNTKVPFSEEDRVDNPVSIYAATKKSNELFAHVYANLYGLHSTGLRYFTVYGPWGRPDMAPYLFTKSIAEGKVINVFNNGNLMRDFTYIDDIVQGTISVITQEIDESKQADSRIYNIGCSNPVKLMDFIEEIENSLGIKSKRNYMPMQAGDVYQTYADTSRLEKEIGYKPSVSLHEGITKFINWYRLHYLS